MVGPTKLPPRARRSLAIASETIGLRRQFRASICACSGSACRRRSPRDGCARPPCWRRSSVDARQRDRRHDFGAVAHDAGVLHQRLDLRLVVAHDLFRIEAVEGGAEGVALAQDGDPGQAGLEAVEDQLFEQRAVVPFGHAPFLVVIGDIERILARPGAAAAPVGVQDGRRECAAAFSGLGAAFSLRRFIADSPTRAGKIARLARLRQAAQNSSSCAYRAASWRRGRSLDFGAVIADMVDAAVDLDGLQRIVGGRAQQRRRREGLDVVIVEPEGEVARDR